MATATATPNARLRDGGDFPPRPAIAASAFVSVNGVPLALPDAQAPAAAPAPAPRVGRLRQIVVGAALGLAVLAATYAVIQTRQVGDIDVSTDEAAFQRLDSGAATGAVLHPGATLPHLGLAGLDGTRTNLSDFRGRPLWVNVWASWCPPCRAELPEVDHLAREFEPRGLAVVAISISEDAATVQRFMQTTGYSLPVFLSPEGNAAAVLRVNGLPTHYFVDRDGKIRDVRFGGMSASAMRAKLARIL